MKCIILIFILAELADLLLTQVGLQRGALELNPIWNGWHLWVIKTVATIAIAVLISRLRFTKWLWIVPGLANIGVVWNLVRLVV
jgi:hypothetical protein